MLFPAIIDRFCLPYFGQFLAGIYPLRLRGLAESHGVVALAHNLFAGSIEELGQPADAAHKEAGVDVEENDSRVAVGVFPVGKKCGLKIKKQRWLKTK